MKVFSTHQISKSTGTPRETLRYYEKMELLDKPTRSANGYRQYTDDDVARLAFIQKTKRAGFTIKEIKELLSIKQSGMNTCAMGKEIAASKIATINKRIDSLEEIRGILICFEKACKKEGLEKPCSLSFY